MKENTKNKIITFIFIIYLFLFPLLSALIPNKEISTSERRKLKTFPTFEITNEYITKLNAYLTDHFPFRDDFRSIKASFNFNILNKLDNNDIFLSKNYIFKNNYPTNINSIDNFKNKLNNILDLTTTENNKYFLVVPDKNYYINDNDFLHINYEYIYNEINKLNVDVIDIRDTMKLSDYYETDTHWKQENLDKVIKILCRNMNLEYKELNYKKYEYNDFYGVYYGESALKRNGEKLTYLSNNIIEDAKVYYLENKSLDKVYNIENLQSLDSYEVFLDGASSYIEINNENSLNEKELIVFRDSFGSSIVPLLIPYYSKITLIDTRYINSEVYSKFINLTNQDILFIYSTLLINNSYSLKD